MSIMNVEAQKKVMKLLNEGRMPREIAETLGINIKTANRVKRDMDLYNRMRTTGDPDIPIVKTKKKKPEPVIAKVEPEPVEVSEVEPEIEPVIEPKEELASLLEEWDCGVCRANSMNTKVKQNQPFCHVCGSKLNWG